MANEDLLIACAALVARRRGRLRRAGTAVNVLAVLWLAFEYGNIVWPRPILAPPGAPWYQVHAALLITALVVVLGVVYLILARPQDRIIPRQHGG